MRKQGGGRKKKKPLKHSTKQIIIKEKCEKAILDKKKKNFLA